MLTEAWDMAYEFERPPRWNPRLDPRPAIVYLDHWCWDHLARDRAGLRGGEPDEGMYAYLKNLVDESSIVLPLTQAHYREHWVRTNDDARWDMAVVMAELTGFTTFNGGRLADWEALNAVASYFGIGDEIAEPQVLGWGLHHCFTGIEREARIVDSQTGILADWSGLAPDRQSELRHLEQEAAYRLELAMLARREPRLEKAGMPPIPPVAEVPGADFDAEQIRIRDAIDAHGRTADVVRNSVEFPAFASADQLLAQAAHSVGQSWLLALDQIARLAPAERMVAIRKVLAAMPVQRIFTELRVQAHLKPEFRWAPSDAMDFFAMSQVIPFADYVVSDRKTYNLLVAGGIDAWHGARLLRRLVDLRAALSARQMRASAPQ